MPTTITSVEKTIFCAMCTRKFEELKTVSARSRARLTNRHATCNSGSSRRNHANGSASLTTVVTSVSAPSRTRPPQRGSSSTTSSAYITVATKLARFWTSQRCRATSRLLKRPSGKRTASEMTTSSVATRASQTRSCGAPTAVGTIHASASPIGRVTTPITAYIASPVEATSLMSSCAERPCASAANRTIDGPTPKSSTDR